MRSTALVRRRPACGLPSSTDDSARLAIRRINRICWLPACRSWPICWSEVSAYLTAMAISAGIYALLTLGVNLTWGTAGMVNLGLAGFFGVGAFTSLVLIMSRAR